LNRLPDDVRDRFVDAVEGRRVLVMGYSGRDFDVFPELVANPPARLVWLMHPGSSLVTEVEAELKRLETTGCQVEYPEATVADYLAAFTDRGAARRSVERAAEDHHRLRSAVDAIGPARARDRPDAELEAALAVVPLSKRALGAARVLFELGEFEQLDKLGLLRPCVGGDAALLRKVRARAQRRRGHNLRALCLLLQPPTSVDAARVVVGNVNEVANLLTRVGAPALGRAADRLLLHFASRRDSAPARRFALQSSVRIGQDLSVRGRLGDATRLLAGVVDAPDVRDVIGLSGEVDATTWLLDALKAQGRYRESLSLVEQMEPKAAYTNLSQRAYAYWQIGSVRLLAGQVSAARNSLQTARDVAAKSGDRQAHAWAVGTLSDAFRDDPAAGRAVLDEAAKAGRPVEELSNHYLAHQYLLLQLAEQSRVEGDLDAASRLVQRAARVRAPGRLRVREQSMNVLATRMIWLLLTAEQADDPSTWLLQAETLRSQYARLGASAAATDVSILLHKVAGHPIPPGVHDWGKDSWQSRWSNDAWQWRRPWHIIA
jgi:hypothetical protein